MRFFPNKSSPRFNYGHVTKYLINIFCKDKLWTGIRLVRAHYNPQSDSLSQTTYCLLYSREQLDQWVSVQFILPLSDHHHRNEKTKKKNKTNDYDSKETAHLTVSKSKDKLQKQMMYLLSETKSLNFPLRPDLFKVLVKIFRTFFEIFEPVLTLLANFILSRNQTFLHLKLNII